MKMGLKQKGALRPPPILAEPFERVSQAIQARPGIVAATHWHLSRNRQVDGADFYFAAEELGHLHLDGEVHLATNLELSVPLVKAGLAAGSPTAAPMPGGSRCRSGPRRMRSTRSGCFA